MEFLVIFLGWLVGMLFIVGTPKAISYVKKKQLESNWKQLGSVKTIPVVDEQGYRAEYDPHYTRLIEKEQGLRIATQCDDTNCSTCYWKTRNLKAAPYSVLPDERKKFIEELPDGLSDELYESMSEDWLKDLGPMLAQAQEKAEEDYHATPFALIQKYKAEGRVFNKQNNSWSSPKASALGTGPLTSMTHSSVLSTPSAKSQKIIDANKRHWKQKAVSAKPKTVGTNNLKVRYNGEWLTLNEHRQQLFGTPPTLIGEPHVISSYEQLMERQAGIQALKSGMAMCRETNQLLLQAKMNGEVDLIRHYQEELDYFSKHVKQLNKQMRDWQLSVQRNIGV